MRKHVGTKAGADDEAKARRGTTGAAKASKKAASAPAKKGAARKSATKAPAGRQAPKDAPAAKKAVTKKAATKTPAAKAPVAKKAATKTPAAAKPVARKAAAKKAATKTPAAKKAATKTPAKKAATKAPAEKAAAKKAAAAKPAKKAAAKRAATAKPAKPAATKRAAAAKPAATKRAAAAKRAATTTATAGKRRARTVAEGQLALPIPEAPPAPPTPIASRAAAVAPRAPESPLEALVRAATAGDGAAAARLGDAYYGGRGVAADVAEAERWWKRAAALGEVAAKESLANLYTEGEGPVRRNLDRALALFRECAAAGLDVSALVGWLEERIAARDAELPEPPLPRDEGEALAVLARRAGLERVAERVSALRRSSVRLAPADGDAGAGRLGGAPALPEGAGWPVGEDGAPLAFVAELDCAEVWPFDHECRLPSEGRLWFFAEIKPGEGVARRACVVRYEAAPAALVAVDPPGARVDERALVPASEPTLPHARAAAVAAIGLDEDEREGYEALRGELIERLWAAPGAPMARALGHADIAPSTAAAARAIDEATRDATLLLSVDARAIGDGEGRLCVWIRDADLAERRFEAAYARLVR